MAWLSAGGHVDDSAHHPYADDVEASLLLPDPDRPSVPQALSRGAAETAARGAHPRGGVEALGRSGDEAGVPSCGEALGRAACCLAPAERVPRRALSAALCAGALAVAACWALAAPARSAQRAGSVRAAPAGALELQEVRQDALGAQGAATSSAGGWAGMDDFDRDPFKHALGFTDDGGDVASPTPAAAAPAAAPTPAPTSSGGWPAAGGGFEPTAAPTLGGAGGLVAPTPAAPSPAPTVPFVLYPDGTSSLDHPPTPAPTLAPPTRSPALPGGGWSGPAAGMGQAVSSATSSTSYGDASGLTSLEPTLADSTQASESNQGPWAPAGAPITAYPSANPTSPQAPAGLPSSGSVTTSPVTVAATATTALDPSKAAGTQAAAIPAAAAGESPAQNASAAAVNSASAAAVNSTALASTTSAAVHLAPSTTSTALTTSTSTSTSTSVSTREQGTLFCWALMLPSGYERGLMEALAAKDVSIFACDNYAVYSDGKFELRGGDKSKRIETEDVGDLAVEYGGPYNNALNSPIFDRVWRKVRDTEIYKDYDWTVKVDPDAVFLPERLKDHLKRSDPEAKVYLNDCDQGLHGPIEVISIGGIRVFFDGIDDCKKELEKEWTWAGEDVWARHCWGQLKIDRVDDFKLLSEQVCFYEDPVNLGCTSGKVAFHPFKDEESYFRCLEETKGPIKSDVNEEAKAKAEKEDAKEYVDGKDG